jgi:hypothetical protein
MSIEGTLPPARQAPHQPRTRLRRRIFAAAIALLSACGSGPDDYLVRHSVAPGANHLAEVRLVRCANDWCERLLVGPNADSARQLTVLAANERCTEIAWSPDGKRAGFVINGQQLRLYEAQSHKPAGQVDLVPRDGDPPSREARGITLSETGAAITFDDCPRGKSGCRPKILALR